MRRWEFTTKPKRPPCAHDASAEFFPEGGRQALQAGPAVLPLACLKLATSPFLRPAATLIPPTTNPNIKRIAFIIVHQEKENHSLSACALGVRLRQVNLAIEACRPLLTEEEYRAVFDFNNRSEWGIAIEALADILIEKEARIGTTQLSLIKESFALMNLNPESVIECLRELTTEDINENH